MLSMIDWEEEEKKNYFVFLPSFSTKNFLQDDPKATCFAKKIVRIYKNHRTLFDQKNNFFMEKNEWNRIQLYAIFSILKINFVEYFKNFIYDFWEFM